MLLTEYEMKSYGEKLSFMYPRDIQPPVLESAVSKEWWKKTEKYIFFSLFVLLIVISHLKILLFCTDLHSKIMKTL